MASGCIIIPIWDGHFHSAWDTAAPIITLIMVPGDIITVTAMDIPRAIVMVHVPVIMLVRMPQITGVIIMYTTAGLSGITRQHDLYRTPRQGQPGTVAGKPGNQMLSAVRPDLRPAKTMCLPIKMGMFTGEMRLAASSKGIITAG